MTIAYTCVLIAIILPLVWAMVAKQPLFKSKSYNNNAPREQFKTLTGASQRADWAQQNAFEALPGFIAAVLIAHQVGVAQGTLDILAMVFIAGRIGHGICYIKDLATLRSAAWAVAYFSMIGMFVAAYMV